MDDSSSPQSPRGRQVLLPAASLNRHIGLTAEGLASKFILQMRTLRPRESAGLPHAEQGRKPGLPGETGAHVQPIHVLADQETEEAHALQLHQRHVGLRGPRALEGGVKFGGQAPLLHRPDTMGAPEGSRWGETQRVSIQGDRGTEKETEH